MRVRTEQQNKEPGGPCILALPDSRSSLFLLCADCPFPQVNLIVGSLSHSLLPSALAYCPPNSESQCVRTLVHVLGCSFHRVVSGIPWPGTCNWPARHPPVAWQHGRRGGTPEPVPDSYFRESSRTCEQLPADFDH